MKASQFRDMSSDELQLKEKELLDQLFKLRLQKATGKLENPAKLSHVQKDYARLKTVLQEVNRGK
ncbi:MAG TPA: 50S ribosomal protein L29 [Thermoanaerobaculia bacterium]|nr:50S ribosomal protein L29 [Thermoanaerobaculia bacterium]HUM30646.1 50S ribosomal protein L29 [Thermoanaerobaculia bacterium]HXK68946.1 50S ribosomal protein L29 [Thermoanaerobaculia bacterium]